MHKKNENQTIKKDEVDNHKITELENKVKELQSIIEMSKDENKIISDKLHSMSKELEESKKYNEELMHRCNTLQNDLKKHMDILNIFEKNAQNSQKELLNSIASKLKCEYIDFKSAKNMPMTVDLGENLRDQINTIFQLLEKNGISVKDIDEFEKKIKMFLNGELKSVSKGARKIAESCDIKTVGKQLKEVYLEVLK